MANPYEEEGWFDEPTHEEPLIRVNVDNGSTIELRRNNASLYRHIAQYAMYDHVFIEDEEQVTSDKKTGNILFLRPSIPDETIEAMTDYMLDCEYEVFLNIRKPHSTDLEAFETMVKNRFGEIPDTLEGFNE